MPQYRDIKLDIFRISSDAYRELKYFCRQYDEKKKRLHNRVPNQEDRNPCKYFSHFDLNRIKNLQWDLYLIEQTVKEVAGTTLFPYLLKNVTQGVLYEYMDVPCGRKQFYELRKQFFILLYCKKNMDADRHLPIS